MKRLLEQGLMLIPMGSVARRSAAIVLHHGVFAKPPADLADGLHNVTPDALYRQLEAMKRSYRFVFVDELAMAGDSRGLASLTFDDGYRSVIDHGLGVIESLDIPATIYVNGGSLRGRVFWRDKVRLIINKGLVTEFERFAGTMENPGGKSFYRYSKHPANNSARLDDLLDSFIARFLPGFEPRNHCFDHPDCLVGHPLLAYGNHSEHHFVLSSLNRDEQAREIGETHRMLERHGNIQRSELFSVPFGGTRDFNEDTVSLLRDFGYRGALFSRQRLHAAPTVLDSLPFYERFMPREDPIELELRRLFVRQRLNRF